LKPAYLLCLAVLLLAGCQFQNIEITGTAPGMDGGVVSIIDLSNQTLFSANISSGKFALKQTLPAPGYYTLSVLSGRFPRDYEIYLEPGSYVIGIPDKENDYLRIRTNSKTQNKLSTYYNFEDSIMNSYRQERAMWLAKLNDPKAKLLPAADMNKIIDKVEMFRNREHGMHIAAMGMFIEKYPQSDIVPHIMTNLDYSSDPYAYYTLFNKLSPKAKATDEGKQVGEQLKQLVKQADARDNFNKTNTPTAAAK
jgi:hypothetical protein